MHITTTDYETRNGPPSLTDQHSWTFEVFAEGHPGWTFEFASESERTLTEAIADCLREMGDHQGWTLLRLMP